jgi:adenylate kinase
LDSFYLDEDKLLDHLEVMFRDFESDKVGVICDYHACDLFPERWFDLVLVLRTSTHVLYDRLSKRGYSDRKRDENMECEIMQVIAEEARESYAPEIVQEVISDTTDDMNSNIERVQAWITQWISERSEDASNDDVTS